MLPLKICEIEDDDGPDTLIPVIRGIPKILWKFIDVESTNYFFDIHPIYFVEFYKLVERNMYKVISDQLKNEYINELRNYLAIFNKQKKAYHYALKNSDKPVFRTENTDYRLLYKDRKIQINDIRKTLNKLSN